MTRISKTEPLTIVKDYRIRYQSTLGEVSKFFLDMANEGKVMGTRCEKCGKTYVPPYPNCPDCFGKTSWVEAPSSGVVEAFTVCYTQPRHFKRKAARDDRVRKVGRGRYTAPRCARRRFKQG